MMYTCEEIDVFVEIVTLFVCMVSNLKYIHMWYTHLWIIVDQASGGAIIATHMSYYDWFLHLM